MKSHSGIALCLSALVVVAGCASTKFTAGQSDIGSEKIARPDRIIVHDLAATPADIPAFSAAASQYAAPATPPTAAEIQTGRKLGAEVAKELVAEIQGMGLPAVQAAGQPAPRVGDIVIIGYFESIHKGSAAERVVLGFGAGAAELRTAVEGYLMTAQGLRKLGSGEVEAGAGKSPGLILPLAVTAATANPIGLIVGSAVKVGEEATGQGTIQGEAKRTAKEIAVQLRARFQQEGWI
jgi:hypothetical protein